VTSYRFALRLHNEVPGIVVPEQLQRALDEAGPNAPDVGFAWARELIEGVRGRAAGVYVMAPYRQPLRVLELV
jgi:homocysteine S-methyltransferase